VSIEEAQRSQILETVDRFAREKVGPAAAAIDEENQFPRELYRDAAELGLLGLWVPEEYGGIGPDLITPLLISERLARESCSFSLVYSNCGDATTPIVIAGSDALKKEWLPKIVSGEVVPCFSLSEPGAGSDAASISTRAERVGDEFVINGTKCWCTNGSVGGVYVVFAKTDPDAGHRGVSAFLVPRETPGLTVVRDEDLLGLRGSPTTELNFENVRIPADHLLGEEGGGFKVAMVTLDEARLNCSAMAIGAGTSALNIAVEYAKERVQFGKPIIEHQGLEFLLAEMTTQMAAARALWEQAMQLLSTDHSRRTSTYAAFAKLAATEAAMKVTVDAVQVLGGNGLSKAYPVERFMRDVKAFEIFDGSTQVQKLLIGRYLKKEGVPF
jgi:alkylation response protein AidB-like acyl-CoA dehydrogenase